MVRPRSDNTTAVPLKLLLIACLLLCLAGCSLQPTAQVLVWPSRTIVPEVSAGSEIQAEIDALSAEPGPFTFIWHENEVNGYLAGLLPEKNTLFLWFEPGQLYLYAKIEQFWEYPIRMMLVPRLESGRLTVDIQLLQYGEHTLKPWQKAFVQDMLNDVIHDTLNGLQFTQVDVGEGRLTISGTTD
ncbi:MAG: hypothetical protein LLG44_12370 [Chloroflexi bacterium]|nr:hypothetical protein [Chloroflexota bacterium]